MQVNDFVFELDAYLDRVGLRASVPLTDDGLATLMRAQMFSIPFENFDILLGRGISVEVADIFEKTVRQRRGGYCFELNGLFLAALNAVGFTARPLLARVHLSGEATGRSHQLSLVSLDGRDWIADTGFGGQTIRAPMPLEHGRVATQDTQTCRLVQASPWGTMLQVLLEGEWNNLYSFDLEHVCPADIRLGNHFTSTHPTSFFTYARVAAIHHDHGSTTLFNTTLSRLTDDDRRIEELVDGEPFLAALLREFGIGLGPVLLPPVTPR